MSEIDISRIKKIVQILSDTSHLDETELSILLSLMKNSKITNGELAKMLDYKDGNSVAYHTKIMQKEGVIGRYTLIPNWKRVGLGTEFIVLAEAENEEQLLEIEKLHVIMADEYASKVGDIVATPTISGCVVLQLSLIHISEPTRLGMISYAVFCLKKKKKTKKNNT